MKIEDQNEKYKAENISFDSNNLKEVMWDKVEYNIDKINSIAVISDLGLSPFFKTGSELKMMQFVHLMVATNVKTITGSEPKDWYRNSNKKEMPLLNRSAAVRYIKKFFGLEGQNNITEDSWREALVNNRLLDKSGEILPMRKIAVNKDFLTAKQKFSASFDSKAEEANRDDA